MSVTKFKATVTVKPNEVREGLFAAIATGLAPLIHGDPGIGKSEIMRQIADEEFAERYGYRVFAGELQEKVEVKPTKTSPETERWQAVPFGFVRPWFRDIRAALLDAVDLRGLPSVLATATGSKVRWAIPEFLPTNPLGGIFFLDEINRGSQMVQNACFSLVLNGQLGEYQMPQAWVRAAAVNDQDSGASKLMAALSSRFLHMFMVADVDDTCNFADDHDWHPAVVAFLRFRGVDLLHAFDASLPASPNPRAWEFVSKFLKSGRRVSANVERAMIAGLVGEAAAIEFVGFLQLQRALPQVAEILSDPANAMVPGADQPSACYAVVAALGRIATVTNFGKIITYFDRIPKPEYTVAGVLGALRMNPSLAHVPAYTKWAIKYSGLTGA